VQHVCAGRLGWAPPGQACPSFYTRKKNHAFSARAQRIEKKADSIAVEARGTILRSQASSTIGRLVDTAEAAIDELEQAAFFASLVEPSKLASQLQGPLTGLCDAAIAETEAAARGLEAAAANAAY